ncbi:MAG: ABC transporter ATP-binding protein [Lachnospiraceae bacterium]|nr:ABC transporter ATP-binding protein [Lachnospiraceae bacterium]
MALLDVKDLGISFGGLKAVEHVNLSIEKGELFGLIGPNGAGKTTVFNLLTGVYQPTCGTILLNGKKLEGKSPAEISRRGVARTFQNIRLFKRMTVLENVMVAFHNQVTYSLLDGMLHTKRYREAEKQVRRQAATILDVFGLEDEKDTLAVNLPYGKQRKLEIARALATSPQLLLLDEPAAGMNPNETKELMDTIQLVRKQYGTTILLIEHDMKLVSGICEKLLVLNFGTELASGVPEEVLKNPEVVTAYLGE